MSTAYESRSCRYSEDVFERLSNPRSEYATRVVRSVVLIVQPESARLTRARPFGVVGIAAVSVNRDRKLHQFAGVVALGWPHGQFAAEISEHRRVFAYLVGEIRKSALGFAPRSRSVGTGRSACDEEQVDAVERAAPPVAVARRTSAVRRGVAGGKPCGPPSRARFRVAGEPIDRLAVQRPQRVRRSSCACREASRSPLLLFPGPVARSAAVGPKPARPEETVDHLERHDRAHGWCHHRLLPAALHRKATSTVPRSRLGDFALSGGEGSDVAYVS